MKTALLANVEKATTSDFTRIQSVLNQSSKLTFAQIDQSPDLDIVAAVKSGADRLFVMGGDGTIISVARRAIEFNIPIVGINYGKLGYLAHFSMDEVITNPLKVIEAPYTHRSTLTVRMNGMTCGVAINDAVIDIGPPFRTSEFMVRVNDQPFSIIRGDGVIIATPTGSTAYNLSAGGPIVEPNVHGMLITPKNPHRLSVRPIVIGEGREINITMEGGQHEGIYVVLDGQQICPFTDGEVIIRTSHHLLLVSNPDHNYFDTLTTKLNWGK